ncbi:MAG: hypothetical protein K8I27_12765, partial [Planctomycetes bacterium]|nr:hypothetical protein [Planctomycetota bacterium]
NGSPATLQITVTPTNGGNFFFDFDINSDDQNENPYDIHVDGSAIPGGEIDLTRGIPLADTDTDTVTGAVAGTPTVLTYTVQNLGSANLTLTGASPVSGNTPVNTGFVGIIQPGASVLTPSGPGSTTTFQVVLNPPLPGPFSLQLEVASDDANENPYNINISGVAGSGGEIDVQRGGSIANGGNDPVGSIPGGVPTVLTYTIGNSGTSALDLTGASFQNNVNCAVSVGAPSQDPIPNPGTATLNVTVTPSALGGGWSFTLEIGSDDADENPYVIFVSGSAPSPTIVTNVIVGADNGGPVRVTADVNGPGASLIDVAVTYTGGLNGPGNAVLLDESGVPVSGNVIAGVPANTTISFFWDAYSNEGHHAAADYVLTLSPSIGAATGTPGSSAPFALDRNAEWSKPYLVDQYKTSVSEHTSIYDPVNNRLVVFGGYRGTFLSNDTWEFDFDTNLWRKLSPGGTPPSPRRETLSVYDALNQRMIVFGGQSGSGTTNDAFALSLTPGGESWAPIAGGSPAFPPPRTHGSLVYDPVNQRAILYGGFSSPTFYSDTWALDLTDTMESWGSGPMPVTGYAGLSVAHAAIYDPGAQRMLVLRRGGDLWELTLGVTPTWTMLTTTNAPAARSYMSAIYDPVRQAMIIQGGLSGSIAYIETWSLHIPSLTWTRLPDDTGSNGRFWHSANYLPGTDRMVILGGRNAARQQSANMGVYDFASSSWVTAPDIPVDAAGPAGRRGAVVAFDSVNNRSLLWGGRDDDAYSDLWELSRAPGASWSRLDPTGPTPDARAHAASVVDAATNHMFVFGGDGAGGPRNDLWALNMTANPPSWQLLNNGAGAAPAPRYDSAIAFDPFTGPNGRLLMFGGRGSTSFGDLWEFDLNTNTWSQPGPIAGTPPPARYGHGVAFESSGPGRLVVFFGRDTTELADMHVLDFGTMNWATLTPGGTAPIERTGFAMVANATGDRVYMFGGRRSYYQRDDLWELNLTPGSESWTMLDPQDSLPAERDDAVMLLDAAGIIVVGAGFWATDSVRDFWEFDPVGAPYWTELALPETPRGLALSQGAYDPAGNRMIVFSGRLDHSPTSGLWELDLSAQPPAWSRLHALGTAPSPRMNASMLYDTSGPTPRMLMYGGRKSNEIWTTTNELWALELPPAGQPTWVLLPTNVGNPGKLTEHTAIMTSGGQMVIFAGHNQYNWKMNNVRVLDPVSLTWSSPPVSGTLPDPRAGARAVLDYEPAGPSPRNRMVVFGGAAHGSLRNETWQLDLNTWAWSLLAPGTPPSARSHHTFTADPTQGRALMFGGRDSTSLAGLYEFDFATNAWTQVSGTHPDPAGRWGSLACWDAVRDRMVLAGGYSGPTNNTTLLLERRGTAVDTWYWGN